MAISAKKKTAAIALLAVGSIALVGSGAGAFYNLTATTSITMSEGDNPLTFDVTYGDVTQQVAVPYAPNNGHLWRSPTVSLNALGNTSFNTPAGTDVTVTIKNTSPVTADFTLNGTVDATNPYVVVTNPTSVHLESGESATVAVKVQPTAFGWQEMGKDTTATGAPLYLGTLSLSVKATVSPITTPAV